MAKQKPYLDHIETRSKMLQNIEYLLDNSLLSDATEQKCCALMSFYRNPPGPGMQYSWNALWVMCSEFNQLYTRLQKLLWVDIAAAKQPKTQTKRRIEAAEIALEIWEKGHNFDEDTGTVLIVPIPPDPAPLSEREKAIRKASINATWKRGPKDS